MDMYADVGFVVKTTGLSFSQAKNYARAFNKVQGWRRLDLGLDAMVKLVTAEYKKSRAVGTRFYYRQWLEDVGVSV